MRLFCMRRKKVEGLVLDLTRLVDGQPFILEDLIVHEPVRLHTLCSSCNKLHFIHKDHQCFMCFRLCNVPTEIREYIISIYSSPCEFCGDTDSIRHFDHINIFDKKACILDIVNESLDDIKNEVAKCQLLCITCHYKVTRFEMRHGFLRKKRRLNKRKALGEDVTDEWTNAFADYEAALTPFYRALRGK